MPHLGTDFHATRMYHDRDFDLAAAKILPGELFVTEHDMVLVTTLGSCVAACIRDPVTGVGGMNHFMLPENASDGPGPVTKSARYGTHAMEMLLNTLAHHGAQRARLEAKVFGGGSVVPGMTHTRVGERNAEFVLEFLAREGISLKARDLVDDFPRKVYFFPRSGRVLVKRLRSLHNDTIAKREAEYCNRLKRASVAGAVELF